jgi:YD repeat-containing protein
MLQGSGVYRKTADKVPLDQVGAGTELAGISSPVQTQINAKADIGHTHASSDITDFSEAVQDAVATALVAGSGQSITYDDASNTITFVNSAPLTTEAVQDIVGAMATAGANVTTSYDDAAGTLTIDATGGGTGLTTEQVQDIVGALLVAGTNVTLNYDDAGNTLTVTAAGGGSVADASASVKGVTRLSVAPAVADTPIAMGQNDPALFQAAERTKLTGIATGATANSTDAVLLARANHTGTQAQSTVTNLTTDLAAKANLASPALTGVPTAPTAAVGTNTTQVATTAFVLANETALSKTTIAFTGGETRTLTAAEWSGGIIEVTGALTANCTIIVPSVGFALFRNATTSYLPPESVTVSGAGTASWNGVYPYAGTYSGAPRFQKDSGHHLVLLSNGTSWVLSTFLPQAGLEYPPYNYAYYATGTAASVPTTGWNRDPSTFMGAVAPAPTVSTQFGLSTPYTLTVKTAAGTGVVLAQGETRIIEHNGTNAQFESSGDMTKAVYDTNNSGVVDSAEAVAWAGVTGKPSSFTPASHASTHATGGGDPLTPAAIGAADAAATTTALANKADLVSGKVPAAQLPAYVDDVLEYTSFAAVPAAGETGIIYVALDTNKTSRWSGSAYVEIGGGGVVLGETASTAYRGDRGAAAYAHISDTANPHSVTKAQVGLGNVDNTADSAKPVSTATQTALDAKANKVTGDGTVTVLKAEAATADFNDAGDAVGGDGFRFGGAGNLESRGSGFFGADRMDGSSGNGGLFLRFMQTGGVIANALYVLLNHIEIRKPLSLWKVSSITTPPSGQAALGIKTDGLAYIRQSTGAETQLTDTSVARPLVITLSGNRTLTATEVQSRMIVLRGTLTANTEVTVPNVVFSTQYVNETTGAYTLTIKRDSTTGNVLAQGATAYGYYDGS